MSQIAFLLIGQLQSFFTKAFMRMYITIYSNVILNHGVKPPFLQTTLFMTRHPTLNVLVSCVKMVLVLVKKIDTIMLLPQMMKLKLQDYKIVLLMLQKP